MENWNRVLSVELNGAKNVNHGLIAFPEATYALARKSCKKSAILGIYGPNGSGKTALVDTFYILKQFSLERPMVYLDNEGKIAVHPILSNYVSVHKGTAECKFQFIQECFRVRYRIDYSFQFKKEKDKTPVLSKETVQIYEPNPKDDGYVKYGKPFAVDYSKPAESAIDLFGLPKVQQTNFETFKEVMSEIISYAKDIQKSSEGCCSFLLSKRMNDIGKSRYQNDRLKQAEILYALSLQIAGNLFVYTVNEGAIQTLGTNVFMGGDESVHGCLMYREKNPDPVNAAEKKMLENIQTQINRIIGAAVPGFQMKTVFERAGKNEKGEEMFNVRFYSVKGKAEIPLIAESNGIQKLVSIAGAAAEIFSRPNTWLVIDELDSGVYEPLLRPLLASLDEEAAGQMIFTAHNLGVLEMLPHDNVVFTTTNPENRYIKLKNVKPTNNFRDYYLRSILVGGQDEELASEIDAEEISSSLYDAREFLRKTSKEA